MEIKMPNPCPICHGPVVYSGRGRRPDYCGQACKNVQRAEDARNRRARDAQAVAPIDPLLRALIERRAQRATQRTEVRRADDEHALVKRDKACMGWHCCRNEGGRRRRRMALE
ncbi:hypothetical protein [Dactylosporangium sp. NPDC051484]|uniref:hypothetical protein n=1 Tax=Dactylosporangium sp. NPDC051484 TaxID=3154942 RepID=UPI00344FFF65